MKSLTAGTRGLKHGIGAARRHSVGAMLLVVALAAANGNAEQWELEGTAPAQDRALLLRSVEEG